VGQTDRQTDRQTHTHRQALADQGSVMCRLGSAIASLTLERVKEGAFVRRLAMEIKYCQKDDRPKLSPNEAWSRSRDRHIFRDPLPSFGLGEAN